MLIMEITVISAEGLKNKSSSLFSRRLRPFVTLNLVGDKPSHVYKTRVDDEGGINPTWGDKFQLPIDHHVTFTYQRHYHPLLYLQLCTKLLTGGQALLGWCQVPTADVANGLSPAGSVHHLSYRLRARDGSMGHGVVNIAVKILEGSLPLMCPNIPPNYDPTRSLEMGFCRTVIGIPVTMLPAAGVREGQWGVSCKEAKVSTSE